MGDDTGHKVRVHLAAVMVVRLGGGGGGKRGRDWLTRNACIHVRRIHKGEQTLQLFRGQTANMSSPRDAALHPGGAGCALLRAAAPSSSKKTPRLAALSLVLLSVMLLARVQPASAHPQCLDFEPPFQPPWHLEFCKQYEEFGCCDQHTDNSIAERYWDTVEQLEVEGQELCADMLKEVMCQVSALCVILEMLL